MAPIYVVFYSTARGRLLELPEILVPCLGLHACGSTMIIPKLQLRPDLLDLARKLDAKKTQWGHVPVLEAWSLKQPWRHLIATKPGNLETTNYGLGSVHASLLRQSSSSTPQDLGSLRLGLGFPTM